MYNFKRVHKKYKVYETFQVVVFFSQIDTKRSEPLKVFNVIFDLLMNGNGTKKNHWKLVWTDSFSG